MACGEFVGEIFSQRLGIDPEEPSDFRLDDTEPSEALDLLAVLRCRLKFRCHWVRAFAAYGISPATAAIFTAEAGHLLLCGKSPFAKPLSNRDIVARKPLVWGRLASFYWVARWGTDSFPRTRGAEPFFAHTTGGIALQENRTLVVALGAGVRPWG